MKQRVKKPTPKPLRPPTDFDRKAYELVGRLIFTYSRLDVNLALFVADHQGYELRENVLEQLSKGGSFKKKLDLVLRTVAKEFPEDADCMEVWEDWLKQADALRLKRNVMIHGRWGFNEHLGEVVNVGGLPSGELQQETVYTLSQLEAEVEHAERIASVFNELRLGDWRRARRRAFYSPSN